MRTPSGISWVLKNRLAMTRLMPEHFAGQRARPVDDHTSLLLDALQAVAPATEGEPTVVPQDQERPRWIGIDPTNRGLASSTLEASVTMTRL